jgi:hypothetical protein
MPGDHAAAVVADDGDSVEFDEIDHPTDGLDVLGDRHRGVGVEPAGTRRWEVDQVTRDVVDQVRQQRAEGGGTDRPSVHEQDVGTGTDTPVGGIARSDVEESIRTAPEEVGCFGVGQCRHRGDSPSAAGFSGLV